MLTKWPAMIDKWRGVANNSGKMTIGHANLRVCGRSNRAGMLPSTNSTAKACHQHRTAKPVRRTERLCRPDKDGAPLVSGELLSSDGATWPRLISAASPVFIFENALPWTHRAPEGKGLVELLLLGWFFRSFFLHGAFKLRFGFRCPRTGLLLHCCHDAFPPLR